MSVRQLGSILLILSILLFLSCSQNKIVCSSYEKSTLHIEIDMGGGTKTTTSQTQEEANKIETLDVFIFRESSQDDNGTLDAYKRFQGEELKNMDDICLTTTTGYKWIYVIANSHISDYGSITNISQFKELKSDLTKEKLSSFTMIGSSRTLLEITTTVPITLERLISCITISSIKTSFAGTPYQGQSLTDIKIYLINIQGNKTIHSGASPKSGVILNKNKKNDDDIAKCKQSGLFSDEVSSAISDNGYTQKHYLYCYENSISSESSSAQFTRAVIQGNLCGKTYYYPININQKGFGHVESNGHYGIKRNTIYSISVSIYRPGSPDPNTPISVGSIKSEVTVSDWNSTPTSNILF